LEAVKYQKKTMKSLLFGILKMNFRGFKVMRMIKQQKKEYTEAERNGKAYEFVNTEKFQAQLAELFDNIYPKWSKSKWARLLQQNWNNRNERIARRITAIHLQNKEIKKIVVFIGAAHIPALKKILSNDDEVLSITTFNKQK
jgi:pheromone shutdown protein TraB